MHEVFETKVATTPTRYPKELQYNLSHLDEENLTSFDVDRNKKQTHQSEILGPLDLYQALREVEGSYLGKCSAWGGMLN